jgi:hypothetical protein
MKQMPIIRGAGTTLSLTPDHHRTKELEQVMPGVRTVHRGWLTQRQRQKKRGNVNMNMWK